MDQRISIIGGGTGISTVLVGLKDLTKNISAIITMADDGGGSGILREDFKMLPPGDIRDCLLALSNTAPALEALLKYRFNGGSLDGQNVGNIILAALNDIYGSFDKALCEMSKVFNITGRVIPVTFEDTHLVAELSTGDKIVGESIIPKMAYKLEAKIIKMSMIPKIPRANLEAIRAIEDSDILIIGPGSLYTSIIPNLIIGGISPAIKNSRAKKIYIANIMTQKGETLGFSLKDHIDAIEKHSFEGIFDYVITNSNRNPKEIFRDYYSFEEAKPIFAEKEDRKFLKTRGINLLERDLIEIKNSHIRHNPKALAEIICKMGLL